MDFDKEKFRPGQDKSFKIGLEGFRDGIPTQAFILPTRYGKSDLIRMLALIGKSDELICQSVVLSPDATLRHQIVRKKKIREMALRYGIPKSIAQKVHELARKEWDPGSNLEYLLSSTIQFFLRNADDLLRILSKRAKDSGIPFVVFIDESHMLSITNEWGGLVSQITEAGGLVRLLTATAVRHDGLEIPGFLCETMDVSKIFREKRRPHPTDETKVLIDLYEGRQKFIILHADSQTTFKEAWDEDPPVLCKLSREIIGIDATRHIAAISEKTKLSEFTPTDVRKALGKLVRDPEVIAIATEKLVSELLSLRQDRPELAAMVFTGSDKDPANQANKDAKVVRDLIEKTAYRHGEKLDCVITTSSYGDETPRQALARFSDGQGDILIVKNAGGAGFDCGRIKIILDLSPVRTVPSVVQRIMRCATPWQGMNVAIVMTFDDILMTWIWRQFVESEGGQASRGEWEFIKTIEGKKIPPPPSSSEFYTVDGVALSGFDDNLGNIGRLELYPLVQQVVRAFGSDLLSKYTKPQIAQKLIAAREVAVPEEPSNDDVIRTSHERIYSNLKEVVNFRSRDNYDIENYGKMMSDLYGEMMAEADIPHGTKPSEITDIEILHKLEIISGRTRQEWLGEEE